MTQKRTTRKKTSPKKNENIFCPRPLNSARKATFCFACALCLAALLLGAQARAQTIKDIYDFTGLSDGWDPELPMIVGPDGSLYGTTIYGGADSCYDSVDQGCGTVYRLTPSDGQWTESTIYQFHGREDGAGGSFGCTSQAALTLDSAGRLYGATTFGVPYDTVYRLSPGAPGKRWQFTPLYEFKHPRVGISPLSPVFLDSSGAIYGATAAGGLSGQGCDPTLGCGAVYQVVPPAHSGAPWTANVLYAFQGANDGGNPTSIFMDSTGTIYGTTGSGGLFNKNCPLGCGVIFQLFPVDGTWAYKVIYSFHGAPHANASDLIGDASGNLYGISGSSLLGAGYGDIFELSPPASGTGSWTINYIHRYGQNYPATNLTLGPDGSLYGDIYGDQDLNWGYIFQLTPSAQPGGAWTYTTLVNFNPTPYQNPCGVVVGFDGDIYSPLTGGGYGNGSIIAVVP